MTWQARRRRTSAVVLVILTAAVFLSLHSCIRRQASVRNPSAEESGGLAEQVPDQNSSAQESQMDSSENSDSKEMHLQTIPGGILIEDVPHIPQSEQYPTGCESVAAVALLQYYGVEITVEELIDQYLPIADYPYCGEDGVMYGDSPWDAFIGDPYSTSGYGCYSNAIVKALKAVVPSQYTIYSVTGASMEMLCENYVAQGHPVMIWATIAMQEPYAGRSWQLPNGEQFQFICPEHALLLIGYDGESYYFSDSLSSEEITAYPKADCEIAYEALYSQAIVMLS